MIIDIHTHLYPRAYLDRLRANTGRPRVAAGADGERLVIFASEEAGGGRPLGAEYTAVEAKLAYMDAQGIDLSVVSVGNPWVDFMGAEEAAEWAARLNFELDTLCAETPRLRGLGVLPLQSVTAACAELERLGDRPRLHGAILGTRPGGRHLDDAALEPFWAAAEARQTPLFIHPHYTVGAEWMEGYGHALLLGLGFTFETTTAAARLILGGVLERHPGLILILAHGGGALPYLAGRLEACAAADPEATRHLRRPVGDYARRLHYDALVYHAPSVTCAALLAGADHLLFGSDHPFGIADPAACLAAIRAAAPEAQALITGGNARRLLGLPAANGGKSP